MPVFAAAMPEFQTPTVRLVAVYYSKRGTTRSLVDSFGRGASAIGGAAFKAIPVDAADDHWEDLHAADGIVFASPTYIGSIAAEFKLFVEKLSNPVWLDRLWVGKLAAGITVSSGRSGDKLNCLMQMVIFAAQMGMIWVPVPVIGGHYSSKSSEGDLNRLAGYLGIMAQANSDQDVPDVPPRSDHLTAEIHGEFFARTAQQLKLGRSGAPPPDPLPWSRAETIRKAANPEEG
jgi:NAD(P)H dehydrogenase (quinone)